MRSTLAVLVVVLLVLGGLFPAVAAGGVRPDIQADGVAVPAGHRAASIDLFPSSRAGPDVTPYNITFNSSIPEWFGYSVGVVGEVTEVEVWIANIGTVNATDVDVTIEIRDFFDNVVGSHQEMVADIPPGAYAQVLYPDWTPQHSAKVHSFISLEMTGDVDVSNNNRTWYGTGWWVDRWVDMADSDADWLGDLSASQWHRTDSVSNDQGADNHTSPWVWYAGTETPVADFYTAGMNVSLISKVVSLKRMNPYYPAFINFRYYGMAAPGDYLAMDVSVDNGDAWIDTRTRVTGATTTGVVLNWFYRIDNWIDEDGDGERDANEFDVGIDISEFVGHDVRFRFRFVSGPTSTGLGYYLDDFIVYGYETAAEVALVTIEDMGTTHVNETEEVVATFWNVGTSASPTLTARMEVYDGLDIVTAEDRSLSSIPAGGTGQVSWTFRPTEEGDYKIEVDIPSYPAGTDSSFLNNKQVRRMHVTSGETGILLVDDDGGKGNSGRLSFKSYEVDTDYMLVDAIDMEVDVTHVLYNQRGPSLEVLQDYHTVVWSTGWDGTGRTWYGTLWPEDRAVIRDYLDGGGSLWLISQEVGFDLLEATPDYLSDVLHVVNFDSIENDDAGTPDVIDGVPGNEITDGMALDARVPVPGNDRSDSIEPAADAEGILYQSDTVQSPTNGPFNGISHNGTHKLVFTTFDISAVTDFEDRRLLANAVVDWLYSGLSLEIVDPEREVEAGGTLNYTVLVRNHGSTEKGILDLTVSDVSSEWKAAVDPEVLDGDPEVVLEGFDTFTASLLVTAPRDYPPGAEGYAWVEMVAEGTEERFEDMAVSTVLETVMLDLSASPEQQLADGGKNASYLIDVRNMGNVKIGVNMSFNGTIASWASIDPAFTVLDPSEMEGLVLTLGVPQDAEAGNYTLDLRAEGRRGDRVGTSSVAVNVTVRQRYDLEVSAVKVADNGKVDPEEGAVNVVVELDNKGNGEDLVNLTMTGAFPDEDEWGWGSREVLVPAFAKAFRTNLSLDIWEEAPGGEYNITVIARSQDGKTVAEGWIILTVLRPDLYLTLDGIVFDYDMVVGEPVEFGVKIFNGGEVDSRPPMLTIYDSGGTLLFEGLANQEVKAGGFIEMTVQWTPEYKGTEELSFYVNEYKDIVEMGYENNTITRSVSIYQPNLKVEMGDIIFYVGGKGRDSVKAGRMVSITAQVNNRDSYSYKARNVKVVIYVDGEAVANRTVDVDGGNIAMVRADWKAVKGLHTVKVVVDPGNDILETEEDDNEAVRDLKVTEEEKGMFDVGVGLDPLWIAVIVIIAVVIVVAYGMARGIIPSPMRQSQVEIADKRYKCNECGKSIKKGKEHYHCACGARTHIKCAKKAELCECLRRVRIDE